MQCPQDAAFGPSSTCRTFDFTLRFSNLVLLLTPSVVLLAAALVRVPLLLRKPDLAPGRADPVGALRTGLAAVHAVFALAVLALVLQRQTLKEALDADSIVPGLALAFLASLAVVPGSMLERRKTARGTAWLPVWLFASCLFDASRVRTFSRVPAIESSPLFALAIVGLVCKAGMLAAENTSGVPRDGTAESRASFLSQLLFLWLWPTIWRGFRAPLQLSDLDELSFDSKSSVLGRRIASVWQPGSESASQHRRSWRPWRSEKTSAAQDFEMDEHDATTPELHSNDNVPPPRGLLWVCVLSFPGAVLAPAVPRLIMVAATLAQPFLVSATLTFAQSFQDGAVPQSTSNGWGLVGAYALVFTVLAFSTGQYYWLCAKAIVKLRGGLIELLYGKSLKLHVEAAKRSGGGAAANLISVDLERFVKIVDPVHNLWSSVVVVAVGLYILYSQIGAVFVATLLGIALNLALTPIASSCGTSITVLQGKWSAKTDARVNLLESAVRDAKGVKFAAYEEAIEKKLLAARDEEITCAKGYLKRLLIVIASSNFNVEIMSLLTFTALGVVDLLSGSRRFTLNTVFTSLTTIAILEVPLMQMGQQYASIVSAYASIKRIEAFLREKERPSSAGTDMRSASAASLSSTRDHKARPASVNSGFSIEVESAAAATFKEATIGWAGKPVLTNVTLALPRGRLTMVCGRIGSGKSTLLLGLLGEADVLSGESQLPMLARPVAFCAQDSWMMEGASIRDNVLFDGVWDAERYQTALRACCLDVDVLQLAQRDRTLAKSLSGGQRQRVSMARALYADAEAYVLDDVTSALDAETAAALWRNLMGPQGLLRGKTIIMASNALHLLPSADFIVRLEEGKVAESGRFEELSVKGKQAISRASIDTERATAGDGPKAPAKAVAEEQEDEVEAMESGNVAWSAYYTWFAAMGWRYVTLILVSTLVHNAAIMGVPIWLQQWARDNDAHPNVNLARNACVLLAIILAIAIALPMELYVLFVTAVSRAGRALHARQLHAVLYTSLAFFSANPAGRIINRFSQDLFTVDWELGIAAGNFISCSAQLLGYVIILCVPAPYLVAVFAGLTAFYYALQRLYMPASRQLRRLEMACKSPLITGLAEASSESGLATVRALGRQRKLKAIMTTRLDSSQKPYLALWAVRHWLRTYLNLISGVVNCALVILVVVLRQSTSIGILAVALVQATQLPTILNQVLLAWTDVEILSIALERIHGYSILEPEESTAKTVRAHLKPDELRGGISVRNLTVSYTPEAPPAIENLSFEVAAGTRLGVVGRSGSGKSTLLLALFRMLEAQKPGSVLLDGTPIDELNVHSLRSCLSIIPQQPLILAASVRDNLDPDGEREDPQLWAALVKTKLDGFVRALPQGLDTMLLSAEGTLSAGQKQLFSLARALLRQRKVLVLDEATSSLDHQTDVEFQECLRDHFDGVTIIAVAHRIVTVRNFDRILVMANGRALEYDAPDALMARPDSAFRALAVEQRVA